MTKDDLLTILHTLQQTPVKTLVDTRLTTFKTYQHQNDDTVFLELCFCLLTANCKAQHCQHIQTELAGLFHNGTADDIKDALRAHHYRFPPRASYIIHARQHKNGLLTILQKLSHEDRRQWLVTTFPGLGLKEASHFLRNIGYDDYAIIDTHIIDILTTHHIITRPRSLTPKRYHDIETILRTIATKAGIPLSALDLYLWYHETGTIIK
jgi:N-glycosylase/DNA lyase